MQLVESGKRTTVGGVKRTTVGDLTTFAYRDVVIVSAPSTMPHAKPWNEDEWNRPCPPDWPEWLPEPEKEMRKPECTAEKADELNGLVLRLTSPTGSLVALGRSDAQEYSRWTCHESIYCIRQDEIYSQGDADPLDEDDGARVNVDLEALFRFASEFVRASPKRTGQKRTREFLPAGASAMGGSGA